MIENVEMKYSVGALLYSPALNNKIGRTILGGTLGDKYSLALCLEDTIAPDMVETAEKQAGETLRQLFEGSREFFNLFYIGAVVQRLSFIHGHLYSLRCS